MGSGKPLSAAVPSTWLGTSEGEEKIESFREEKAFRETTPLLHARGSTNSFSSKGICQGFFEALTKAFCQLTTIFECW